MKNSTEKIQKKSIMIGLPEVGKTTFLAALWHVVDSNEVANSLKLNKFTGDIEYLNQIRSSWISCTTLERTQPSEEKIVSMELKNPNNDVVTELTIPDLSGETFKGQWLNRQWTKAYGNLVKEASGALLFIHPDQVKEPARIDQAEPLVETIEGRSIEIPHEQQVIEWKAENTPTQVILVELLQYIQLLPEKNFPFKIAVVISAWDLVETFEDQPIHYLITRLPLLYQYLLSNSEDFPFRVYGISAQGGTFDSADRLLEFALQSERIFIKTDGRPSHNISEPLIWLME